MANHLQPEFLNLLAAKNLHPSPTWTADFLTSQRPTVPIQALVSTATFRLLAADITVALSAPPHATLPNDVQSPAIKERRLGGDSILVQVLDVEDIGRSRWAQVEEIEALERGEGTRGREIIRVEVPEVEGSGAGPNVRASAGSGGGSSGAGPKGGPHKILLQDVKGNVVPAFEAEPIDAIRIGMSIGSKMLLKGSLVARGMVLLEPGTVKWLGGKVESRHNEWVKGRKAALKRKVEDAMDED